MLSCSGLKRSTQFNCLSECLTVHAMCCTGSEWQESPLKTENLSLMGIWLTEGPGAWRLYCYFVCIRFFSPSMSTFLGGTMRLLRVQLCMDSNKKSKQNMGNQLEKYVIYIYIRSCTLHRDYVHVAIH